MGNNDVLFSHIGHARQKSAKCSFLNYSFDSTSQICLPIRIMDRKFDGELFMTVKLKDLKKMRTKS